MLITNVNLATAVKRRKNEESNKLWPEEEKALKDIMTGKVKTTTVSGQAFLRHLKDLTNEEK